MRIELLLACCLANAACFTTTYVTKRPMGGDQTAWHHNFIAGFVEAGAPVDLREHCPNGFARVKTEVSFINGLAAGMVNGATSYALDAAIEAGASDLNDDLRTGITVGYNVASSLFDPIWSPSTLTITCVASGTSPAVPEAPPEATKPPPADAVKPEDGFNAFSPVVGTGL